MQFGSTLLLLILIWPVTFLVAIAQPGRSRAMGPPVVSREMVSEPNENPGLGSNEDDDDPVATLSGYYAAINAKDYKRAYRYWENPPQTIQQFIRGFNDTSSVRLLVDPSPEVEGAAGSSYANLTSVAISRRPNGGERMFAGCYVMRKSNLRPEDGQSLQGWHIYRAKLFAVSSNAGLLKALSKACVE